MECKKQNEEKTKKTVNINHLKGIHRIKQRECSHSEQCSNSQLCLPHFYLNICDHILYLGSAQIHSQNGFAINKTLWFFYFLLYYLSESISGSSELLRNTYPNLPKKSVRYRPNNVLINYSASQDHDKYLFHYYTNWETDTQEKLLDSSWTSGRSNCNRI